MQRDLWDGVENRCQNKKLGRFIFLWYYGWELKISVWTGIHWTRWNDKSGVIRESVDLPMPRPVLFLGTLFEGKRCWEHRAKRGMGIRVRTGFVGWELALQLYHFPPIFIAFPFLIHSANTSWPLGAWHFTGHLGFEDEYRKIPALKESGDIFKYWPTTHPHSHWEEQLWRRDALPHISMTLRL